MKELVDFLPKSIKFNSASDDLKEECFNFLKTFELQGQVEVTKSANGFGFTMITGEATTSIVEIYKEA